MKNVFKVFSMIIWIGGAIGAIVIGATLKSFLYAVISIVAVFIEGALFYALYMLLDNQETILSRLYSLSGKSGAVSNSPAVSYPSAASAPSNSAAATSSASSRPRSKLAPSPGSWACTCGRVNANYVTTCMCGKKKADVLAAQNASIT